MAGLRSNPPYHEHGSAPGSGRVTSAIYLNGEEKTAVRWSFEIGIGGEGEQKFCELTSGRNYPPSHAFFPPFGFRLSKKPLRRRESASTHVKFDG